MPLYVLATMCNTVEHRCGPMLFRLLTSVKFSVTESGPSSRPASPSLRNRLTATPRPNTPVIAGTTRPYASSSLLPKHPIQTPQHFYDWFALIDRSVTHSQEAHFRAHLSSVADHLQTCDALVQRIDEIDQEVEAMLQGWRSVEEGGKSLKDACEELLEERVRISAMILCVTEADRM